MPFTRLSRTDATQWVILLCPIMFNNIQYYALFIFAACNALAIPIVWALYPESNQRTLEVSLFANSVL